MRGVARVVAAVLALLGTSSGLSGCGMAPADSAGSAAGGGIEQGRMVGMTAAHNAVRASVDGGSTGPLPALEWSDALAQVAQSYADHLAATCTLQHSSGPYGENLAYFYGQQASPSDAVTGWANERRCYTYGTFASGDRCDTSAADCQGGCGHFTQIVWRATRRLGCGVAACAGSAQQEIWVCNYDPPGNFLGEPPY